MFSSTSKAASAANKSPVKPRGNTRTYIVAVYHGNVSIRRDVFVDGLEEHDHFYPVRLDPTPVWPEEVTASTEITLDLRSCSLVAKHLLCNWREVGELDLACWDIGRRKISAVNKY